MMNKKCIYTCILGNYDILITPKYVCDDYDYICFTDQNITNDVWEIRKIPNDILDLSIELQNKWIKMHPHIILNEYDLTIFVDGNIFIKDNIDLLVNYDNDITLIKHTKNNIKSEAEACIKQYKVNVQDIHTQVNNYYNEGYVDTQLTYNGILIRKNTEISAEFNECWYKEVLKYTLRDQISSPYIIWKNNFNKYISYIEYKNIFDFIDICTHNRFDINLNNNLEFNDKQIKTALCCTTYNENDYILDFINYYICIGINHFFIYDCNDNNELIKILYHYIKLGYIDVIKWKYVNQLEETLAAYQECYENRLDDYDWCCFFCVNEYLRLYIDNNINDYLNRKMFNDANIILINSNIIDDKSNYVNPYMRKENRFFKSIVRCKSKIRNFYKAYINWMNNNIFMPEITRKYIDKIYKSYGINNQYDKKLGLVKKYNYKYCSLNIYPDKGFISNEKEKMYNDILNYI